MQSFSLVNSDADVLNLGRCIHKVQSILGNRNSFDRVKQN